jgi:hypothetical protein
MRRSKQEAAETRQLIISAAAAEFRRNGISDTGLSDLMGAAGLTHGWFYRHFESKDQLQAGLDAGSLTWSDLAPLDQFHVRGLAATKELAEGLGLNVGSTVIDGGAARYRSFPEWCVSRTAGAADQLTHPSRPLPTRQPPNLQKE